MRVVDRKVYAGRSIITTRGPGVLYIEDGGYCETIVTTYLVPREYFKFDLEVARKIKEIKESGREKHSEGVEERSLPT